jgi:hypothetical protein
MLELALLVPFVEFLWDDALDSEPVLPVEDVVVAVAMPVHVVRADVPSDLAVLVQPAQLLAFGVAVVLERDGIVGQSACIMPHPLLLAVRLAPCRCLATMSSCRSLRRRW